MNKKLDLTAFNAPELELTLPDGKTYHVLIPDVQLLERIIAAGSNIRAVANAQDTEAIKSLYALAAEFISENTEGQPVSAEELRDKHRVKFVHLILIYHEYIDFIHGIQNAKN